MSRIAALSVLLLAATPALAHPGHGGDVAAGFAHPFGGFDHVLAMVAVGVWAALRGGRAAAIWPVSFVLAMAGGFAATQIGLVVPAIETMIAASVILLGAAIALRFEAPTWLGAAAIAAFGLAHGAAHGMELHGAQAPAFATGFVAASALLHAAGYGLSLVASRLTSIWAMRAGGVGVAAAGLVLALHTI